MLVTGRTSHVRELAEAVLTRVLLTLFKKLESEEEMVDRSRVGEVIESIMKNKVTVYLSSYGSTSAKPITIWSTTPLIQQLKRPKGLATERLATNKNGAVTGRRKKLKASQAYPPAFGQAVSAIYQELQNAQSLDDLLEEDEAKLLSVIYLVLLVFNQRPVILCCSIIICSIRLLKHSGLFYTRTLCIT